MKEFLLSPAGFGLLTFGMLVLGLLLVGAKTPPKADSPPVSKLVVSKLIKLGMHERTCCWWSRLHRRAYGAGSARCRSSRGDFMTTFRKDIDSAERLAVPLIVGDLDEREKLTQAFKQHQF